MTELKLDISVSVDGYVAGPDASLDDPLGKGGMDLHQWALRLESWREAHGYEGGETGIDSQLLSEHVASVGATIMGRKMFSGGSGEWADDPNDLGWWGDEPPFGHPVFILTHHEREAVEMAGGTTFNFVTDGIQSALDQAREAAGGKDVAIGGGADVAQQYLNAGLVNQVRLHIAPVVLGSGRSLLDGVNPALNWEQTAAQQGNGVTHITYRIS
jgi:dihydrofolate reductase